MLEKVRAHIWRKRKFESEGPLINFLIVNELKKALAWDEKASLTT
jgi:hypothetical protein